MSNPWHFQRWAFDARTGSAGRKAVLNVLALMADTNTGRCEAKVETIADGSEQSARTVRSHLKALDEAGFIARRPQFRADGGRRGDEFLLLAPGVTEWPDGTPVQDSPGGDLPSDDPTPSPPVAAQERPLRNDHAKAKKEPREDEFPDDLPPELFEIAIAAGKILKRVAVERGQAKAVTRLTVGHAVLTYPDRDHVLVAREVEAWMLHGRGAQRSCRDVVARYRNFLSNAEPRPGPPLPGGAGARRPNAPSSGPGTLRAMADEIRKGAG